MEKEIINTEVIEDVNEGIVVDVDSGNGLGKALVAVGVVGAGFALYKLGKMVWAKHKAKKEAAAEEQLATDEEAPEEDV